MELSHDAPDRRTHKVVIQGLFCYFYPSWNKKSTEPRAAGEPQLPSEVAQESTRSSTNQKVGGSIPGSTIPKCLYCRGLWVVIKTTNKALGWKTEPRQPNEQDLHSPATWKVNRQTCHVSEQAKRHKTSNTNQVAHSFNTWQFSLLSVGSIRLNCVQLTDLRDLDTLRS